MADEQSITTPNLNWDPKTNEFISRSSIYEDPADYASKKAESA